ncbi:MAG TPA: hypothetical protein VGM39_04390 [Kofleriaceae bacterium]|jgi:hypothetical protein
MKSSVLVLGILAACGGDDGGGGGSVPKASYRVDGITNASEVGDIVAFNANGYFVSHSGTHGWTVTNVDTKVFTQITAMTGFVGFDDAGDLLYSVETGGPVRYFVRHGNGAGADSEIPSVLADGLLFIPFALGNDGTVWGYSQQRNPNGPTIAGYARYAIDHADQFRDWAGHEPTNDLAQIPRGVDTTGNAVFCETAADQSGDNGLPETHCRVAASDNTLQDIGTDVPDFWSVLSLRPITPSGRLGGEVTVGQRGFGGSFPALFGPSGTEILGDQLGDVLGIIDRGDVIFTQLHVAQPVRVRTPSGDVRDLTPYLINPNAPNAEVSGITVLALAPDGRILISQDVLGTSDVAIELLTPE